MSDRRRIVQVLLCSALVLIPCFWQSRIQAGDLSSHVYNAWLTQLIARGQAPGLIVVGQTHNVLFDLMLGGLLRVSSAAVAQRIAVSLAVLIFFWGALAFISPRRIAWQITPCLAMLAYSWVYHMGLFNFYMSLGFSLAAIAAGRASWPRPKLKILVLATLLALAWTAHALPCLWAVGVLVYLRIAGAMRPRNRIWLLAAAIPGIELVSLLVRLRYTSGWSPDQKFAFTGADQIWTFGARYLWLTGAVMAIWLVCLAGLWASRGAWRMLLDLRLHLWILNAACILLIPGIVVLPASGQAESLLLGRMSLAGAVLLCALAASAPRRKWLTAAMTATAAIFFVFVYQDERALNRIEDQMDRVVAAVPPGSRVVSALMDPNRRMLGLLHVIDRACLGRCFSYANYEPSVGQFRVRAERPNPVVVADFRESWAMQAGGYVVKPSDLPLYRVDLCPGGRQDLCVASVPAGATLQSTRLVVH